MIEEKKTFAEWALVELMGRQRIVGMVTEQVIAGAAMLRVDVPDVTTGETAFTRFYGGSAIYAINPIAKEVALKMLEQVDAAPIKSWELRPALPEPPEQPLERSVSGVDDF